MKLAIRVLMLVLMVSLCGASRTKISGSGKSKVGGSGKTKVNAQVSSFTPADVASTKRWIRADNLGGSFSNTDPIGTAVDQSGNGNDLTQTGANRPTYATSVTNGLPGISFDRNSTQYLTGSVVTAASAVSFFVAFKPVSITGFDVELVGTDAGNTYYRADFDGNGYFGEFRTSRVNTYPPTVPSSGVHIISIISSGSSYTVWIDGVSQGAQAAGFSQGSVFNLGVDSGAGKPWNGYVFEIVECNADVGSTVRGQMETYLTRWQ